MASRGVRGSGIIPSVRAVTRECGRKGGRAMELDEATPGKPCPGGGTCCNRDEFSRGMFPCGVGDRLAKALAENERLRAERDALAKFKAWVHDWLTGVGVPHDPDPEHTKEHGCRVG